MGIMEVALIKELGFLGAGAVGMFFLFKNQIQETQRQNNEVVSHLMETNKHLHSVSIDMSNKFNITVEEHTKAIQELREEIRRMNEK